MITNINNEFSTLLQLIDYDIDHLRTLNKGYSELDRYQDIKAYNHNIITINNNKENYINASPMNIIKDKYFISTQGPKRETIEDFWTMIDQYNCNVIIMLCNEEEGGVEKCVNYWNPNEFDKYILKQAKIDEQRDLYIIREFKLYNKEKKTEKKIKQIHYIGWPDGGVPETEDGIVFDNFDEIIQLTDKYRGEGPIVVHCSAGVGRTGSFISMYLLKKEIISQISDKIETIRFSVFNLVRKLKEMRLYSVQTFLQYSFVYQFVSYLLNKYNI